MTVYVVISIESVDYFGDVNTVVWAGTDRATAIQKEKEINIKNYRFSSDIQEWIDGKQTYNIVS